MKTNNLLIATGNPHKIRKISEMFIGQDAHIQTPKQVGITLEIDEDKATFEENATLKAVEYSRLYDGIVVATDGGMTIPSLEGWNPLRTKRFAGESATDEERIAQLLKRMVHKQGPERSMVWREAVAIAKGGKKLFSIEVPGAEGVMATSFNPKYYRPGIWVCSIWEFPQFDGKNFFELNENQVKAAEISWGRLGEALGAYLSENEYFAQ
jgi:inosine/xanthosine triphosphate pyrophosphatase family protein